MRTKAAIKKAAGLTAAKKKTQHSRVYPKPVPLSRNKLKENIGLLLIHLQSPLSQQQRRIGWKLVEIMYEQYLPAKGGIV